MARSSSALAPASLAAACVLALVASVLLFSRSPSFIPSYVGPAAQVYTEASLVRAAASGAAPALLGIPLSASAATPLPEPVIGIGLLSVIVVIVLVISGLVIARGLLDDEVGGEL